MIKIFYNGERANIKHAVKKANQLLRNKHFYEQIGLHDFFDMANVTPEFIAALIQKTTIEMSLKFYYSGTRSNAYGFDNILDPNCIQLNVWTIDRSVDSLCNTMIHACVHAVNAQYPEYSFGHNKEKGKLENTAPFWIGCLAQKMLSGENTATELTIHETDDKIYEIFECMVLPVS